jgi:hypothetical protein
MKHEQMMSLIAKKLQFKPGKRWLFYNAPTNYLTTLEPLPDGAIAKFALGGDFDGIQLFVKDSTMLNDCLKFIAPLLTADTIFWITYPKKSSGIQSDLEMMGNWDELAKYGLTTVAIAAIDETWTAIRLRQKGLSKVSEFRNEGIKKNEYSAFIDVDKKLVTLPHDMKTILEQSLNALAFYRALSYSNKKEYVVWILSAKQEKTRTERLEKLVEKLLAKKKNPSDK